jgi:hypothetical protein
VNHGVENNNDNVITMCEKAMEIIVILVIMLVENYGDNINTVSRKLK